MRVPKRPFVFLQWNRKFYSCTQTAIRFLQPKTKFYSCTQTAICFFYSEIQDFTVAPKLSFVLWLQNTKLLKLFRMRVPKRPVVFFTGKYKILQLYQNGNLFFTAKCKILKTVPKRPFLFLQRNTKFWKLRPNGHLCFCMEVYNFENCTQAAICIFHKELRNLAIYHQFSFVS